MLREGKALTVAVALLAGLILGAAITADSQRASGARRRVINLAGRTDTLPYSNAVLVGDTLYLAGRIGVDSKTGRPPDDLEAEIRLVFDGMRDVLAAAGMTMNDVVTVTVYCPDLTLYDKFNAVYRTYFGKDFPARAFIGSGPLLRGGHFEVQAIAAR